MGRGGRKLKEVKGEIAKQVREAAPLTKCKSGQTTNQVREERPAVSSHDVTQVSAGGTEAAGGQCS